MKKTYLYIFIRADLSPSQMVVMASHAAWDAALSFGDSEHPNLVLLKVEDVRGLMQAQIYVENSGLKFISFHDSWYKESLCSVAVQPILEEQRYLFKDFKLATF